MTIFRNGLRKIFSGNYLNFYIFNFNLVNGTNDLYPVLG